MDVKIRSQELNEYNEYVDIFYSNIASIKQEHKTRKCTRVEYALELVKKHRKLLKDTLNKPMRRAMVTEHDKAIIAKSNWQELMFMNPERIITCQEATLRALEAYRIPLKGMSAMTVIDRRHEQSSVRFQKEAALLKQGKANIDVSFSWIKKEFQKGLRGFNYIGVIEFAIFRKEPFNETDFDDGFLIAPHLQGLIWRDEGITSDIVREFNKKKFSGGRFNAVGFKHERVWDITGSVSYMHKLPLFAYDFSYKHTSEGMSQDTAYIMFERLKHICFDDMFISGGEGQNVRSVTLNYLKEFYQKYET